MPECIIAGSVTDAKRDGFMTDTTHFFTPSLARTDDGIWCLYRQGEPGPVNGLWLANAGEDLTGARCLRNTTGLMGECLLFSVANELMVAWTEKTGGNWYSFLAPADDLQERLELPSVAVWFAAASVGDGAWLTWQTNDARSRVQGIHIGPDGSSDPVDVSSPGLPSWKPDICAVGDQAVVAWDSYADESYDVFARTLGPGGTGEVLRITEGEPYDRGVTVAADDGGVWLSWMRHQPWHKSRYYRLCIDRNICCRRLDLSTGELKVLENREEAFGGRVPIELEYTGLEAKLPINPRVICGQNSNSLHVLYRQASFEGSAPHSGERMQGWDLKHIAWTEEGWSEPEIVSPQPGYSSDRVSYLLDGDEAVVACDVLDYPGDRNSPGDSDIAIFRMPTETGVETDPQFPVHVSKTEIGTHEVPDPAEGDNRVLLWGDLHRHSDMSHCLAMNDGNLWDHFRWAKDVAGLDFYALTDHLEHISTSQWYQNATFADLMHRDGEFISLYGMEVAWIDEKPEYIGHFNIFCTDPQTGEILRDIITGTSRIEELYQELDALDDPDILLIKHFHAVDPDAQRAFWKKVDETSFRPDYEPVFELVQNRGFAMETANRWLQAGQKIGFVAGCDHGRPHYMTYAAAPDQTYLTFKSVATGVWARECTRQSLLEAIHERRTLATNGQKPVIELNVGTEPTGHPGEADLITLELFIQTPTPMVSWRICRDEAETVAAGWNLLNRRPSSFSEIFETEISGIEEPGPGEHYYYVDVQYLGIEGAHYHGRAVTSPVWVTPKIAEYPEDWESYEDEWA